VQLFSKNITKLSDEQLMVLYIQKGHNKYIEEIYKRYSPKLLGYFFRMLNGDHQKAQDLLQDLFLKVIEKKQQFDPSKKLYTWLFTIASNSFKSDYRKLSNRNTTRDLPIEKTPLQYDENLFDRKEFKIALRQGINLLTSKQKATFILRYHVGFSVKEIAEITAVSEGTVKSRIYYATQQVSEYIKEFSPINEPHIFKHN
jgi:RNA polymerase sigma-70 factor (ECF subfamily)